MEVTAYWSGGYRCRLPIRQFQLLADEPELVAGGTDTGPMPTELLLAALASCFAMALAHVARRHSVELPDDLSVTASGHHTGPRFTELKVEVRTAQPVAGIEALLGRAAAFCYVSNTLRIAPRIEYAVARS